MIHLPKGEHSNSFHIRKHVNALKMSPSRNQVNNLYLIYAGSYSSQQWIQLDEESLYRDRINNDGAMESLNDRRSA
uniref:Uncharacterized protein n=1 Tax=Salix viminalis TaxID=40686 RepID=A0A6N2MYQ0_SALVM